LQTGCPVAVESDALMAYEVLSGWMNEGELEGFKSFQA